MHIYIYIYSTLYILYIYNIYIINFKHLMFQFVYRTIFVGIICYFYTDNSCKAEIFVVKQFLCGEKCFFCEKRVIFVGRR